MTTPDVAKKILIPGTKIPASKIQGRPATRAQRLAASNIAWPRECHDRAVDLLCELGVDGLEIAPLNVFSDWSPGIFTQAARLRQRLGERGLCVPALQGWLFGVDGCALFRGDAAREAMVEHCRKVARLAGILGAGACVYGAPRSRDPGDLTRTQAWDEAVSFLKEVGPIFAGEGSALAFEANAQRYGCRFATTTREAVDLVREADTPGVGLQIDTGTIFLEDLDPGVLTQAVPYAVHMHVSEPDLAPTGTSGVDHRPVAASLEQSGYEGWISIEMRAVPDWENALRNAVSLVRATYPGLVAAMSMVKEKRELPAYRTEVFGPRVYDHALVIPVINEGERIREQLRRIAAVMPRTDVVIADGGSTDGSLEADFLKGVGVRAVLTKTGPGKLSAQLRMAYAWCLDEGYSGIVTIDGNGKDGVEAIDRFVEELEQGFDYVQGSRYRPGGEAVNTPLDRTLAGRLIHAPLISLAGRAWYTDTTNGFRGYSRRYLLDPRVQPFRDVFDRYQLLFYLSVRAGQIGMRTCEIPVRRSYPANEPVPTKVSGLRGRFSMMEELLSVVAGRFNP